MKKAHDFATMETFFAISDNPASERYGTTCFGQDVAAYTEIVTVMVGYSISTETFHINMILKY